MNDALSQRPPKEIRSEIRARNLATSRAKFMRLTKSTALAEIVSYAILALVAQILLKSTIMNKNVCRFQYKIQEILYLDKK